MILRKIAEVIRFIFVLSVMFTGFAIYPLACEMSGHYQEYMVGYIPWLLIVGAYCERVIDKAYDIR